MFVATYAMFCSWRTQAIFKESFGTMPWLALPFGRDHHIRARLLRKFGVRDIPSLVLIDPMTTLITAHGKEAVSKDRTGAQFPWAATAASAQASADSSTPKAAAAAPKSARGLASGSKPKSKRRPAVPVTRQTLIPVASD